jgi:hypothetical protein
MKNSIGTTWIGSASGRDDNYAGSVVSDSSHIDRAHPTDSASSTGDGHESGSYVDTEEGSEHRVNRRRRRDLLTKEEEDDLNRRFQLSLSPVKPELQRVMYFM